MPRTLDYWRLTRNTDPWGYFFHLRCYFKRPISSPVRTLACNWYYCAHFIAKPKAACALRFSWVATSSNLGLCASVTSSIKPEVPNVSLRRHRRTEPWPQVTCVKIGEDWTCSSEDMIANRQTLRQTDTLITILCSPIGGGVIIGCHCSEGGRLSVFDRSDETPT